MGIGRVALALGLAMSLAAGGCAFLQGVVSGAGAPSTYVYEKGKLQTTYSKPYDRVYDATVTSLKRMGVGVGSVEKDAAGARVEAQRSDGTPVWVDLTKTGPDTTDASIRVGSPGEEAASLAIANGIAQDLGLEVRRPTGRGQR